MSVKSSSQLTPIPPDLKAPHSETPWRMTTNLFQRVQNTGENNNSPYKKVPLSPDDPEFAFVYKYFHHQTPTNRTIGKIYVLHNPNQSTVFEGSIPSLEEESKGKAFKPGWKGEKTADLREKAHSRWKSLTVSFNPFQIEHTKSRKEIYQNVKVLPLFHGSSAEKCDSIACSGFTYFGKHSEGKDQSTDVGYFGSGIYFTTSARYATDIYSDGQNLLLSWVSMREPYPVVSDTPSGLQSSDMTKLTGKGAYENYNAHYIPVISSNPDDPKCANYFPCSKNQVPALDELVVFQSKQTLPRFWIEMVVDLPKSLTTSPKDLVMTVGALIDYLLNLLENPEVKNHPQLGPLLEQKWNALFKFGENDPLSAEDQEFYRKISRLIDTTGKIRETVVKLFSSSSASSPKVSLPLQPPKIEPKKKELLFSMESPSITTFSTTKASKAPVTLPAIAFGAAKWAEYIGDVGEEPPFPFDIDSPCPFTPGKTLGETHLFTLIPKTVNGKFFNLNSLEEYVKKPKKGFATQYGYYWEPIKKEYGGIPVKESYWVALTMDVIKGSRNKTSDAQKQLLADYSKEANVLYEMPQPLEAITSIFMKYLQSGVRLYSANPPTYTSCQKKVSSDPGWPLVVGGFAPDGLNVYYFIGRDYIDDFEPVGVGGVRKFS